MLFTIAHVRRVVSHLRQTRQAAECENSPIEPLFPGREMKEAPMTSAAKLQIMVVDDDESIRESLGLVLQASVYETVPANNGFDALLQLKRSLPAIVLSDLNMPQM